MVPGTLIRWYCKHKIKNILCVPVKFYFFFHRKKNKMLGMEKVPDKIALEILAKECSETHYYYNGNNLYSLTNTVTSTRDKNNNNVNKEKINKDDMYINSYVIVSHSDL